MFSKYNPAQQKRIEFIEDVTVVFNYFFPTGSTRTIDSTDLESYQVWSGRNKHLFPDFENRMKIGGKRKNSNMS